MKLNGNTILITGGSSGIGFEMAKELLACDNKVIITGRNLDKLELAKQKLDDIITFQSDVSDFESVAQLSEEISKKHTGLNVVINNAGVMFTINLQSHKLSPSELTKELDINVKGTIWMNDAFLPLLKKNKNAAIVNVSSALAFVPLPISPVYCATKAAIHSYTLSLREQLRNIDVSVFELAPPGTETELLEAFDEKYMEGASTMKVEALVASFLKGFSKDNYEICPGQSSQMKFMSRFFPGYILKQLSKTVDVMHTS